MGLCAGYGVQPYVAQCCCLEMALKELPGALFGIMVGLVTWLVVGSVMAGVVTGIAAGIGWDLWRHR